MKKVNIGVAGLGFGKEFAAIYCDHPLVDKVAICTRNPETAPNGLKVGDTVVSGAKADIKPGNSLPMMNIPTGTFIHNIELYPGKGAQLARSAGVMAQLMAKENGML